MRKKKKILLRNDRRHKLLNEEKCPNSMIWNHGMLEQEAFIFKVRKLILSEVK